MSRKSRRARGRKRSEHQVVSRRDSGQPVETPSVPHKQVLTPRSGIIGTADDGRYRHLVVSDVRRTVLVAGMALSVLIILYVFLR